MPNKALPKKRHFAFSFVILAPAFMAAAIALGAIIGAPSSW